MKNATPYDSAAYLDTEDAIEEYMAAAFETEDPAFIAQALGTIARAQCQAPHGNTGRRLTGP